MHDDDSSHALTRRRFLRLSVAGAALSDRCRRAPAIAGDAGARPVITSGVQTGDVELDRAVVWCRTDRPARLRVRYGTTDALAGARERVSAPTSAEADFTARLDLTGLPPGQRIVYEARFEGRGGELSEPVRGAFRTPARGRRRRCGSSGAATSAGRAGASTKAHGGMRTFASMRAAEPDLFIHSGDVIYADAPIPETLRLDDGSTWRNLVEDGVGEVAQTLDQFRGRYRYNLRDAHLRAFNAEVPMVAQWDDHEVLNNWYPTEVLGAAGNDARYTEKQVAVLAARAKQAFFDYTPIRPAAERRRDPRQVYRVVRRGPLADVFVLDCRSYRGPNTANLQAQAGPETAMLAATQRAWLEEALARSTATWKIIACDQPIGVVVPDGPLQEGFANADPRTLGREHEVAALLVGAQAPPRPQRAVRHRRRALRRRAPLRPGARDLHRLRSVLGVRRRAAPRRHLRPGRARRDVRPRGRLHVGGAEAQSPAERRAAVLRARGDRSGDARRDRDAARSRRQDPLHEGG